MAHNLRGQLLHAINSNSATGQSKHSAKAKGLAYGKNASGKIYSYSSANARRDVAKNFSNWMKENHPEVKQAKDLTSEHAQGFLNDCASRGCSTDTIKSYRSELSSLGKNINSTYKGSNVDMSKTVSVKGYNETKVRNTPMKSEHIEALRNSYKVGSTGYNAVTVAQATGARAAELCHMQGRDIHINSDGTATVHVDHGKGGRNRDIIVRNQEHVQNLAEIKNNVGETGRICPCQVGSLHKNLNRHMDKVKDSTGKSLNEVYNHQGFHSMRKDYAQREYDRCRDEGMSIKDSMNEVSHLLGHGDNREELMSRYIADMH